MGFTARYHGICLICEEDIEPGQLIKGDDTFGYGHEDCYRTMNNLKPKPICPKCHIQRPCDCE